MEACEVERRRQQETDRLAEVRRRVAAARTHGANATEGLPLGMTLDEITQDDSEPAPEQDAVVPKKPPVPKTKQQRAKALRLRAEVGFLYCCFSSPLLNSH